MGIFSLINTSPDVGASIVEIIFSKVDLPLPDAPIIPTNSPFVLSNQYWKELYKILFLYYKFYLSYGLLIYS